MTIDNGFINEGDGSDGWTLMPDMQSNFYPSNGGFTSDWPEVQSVVPGKARLTGWSEAGPRTPGVTGREVGP